MRCSSVAGRAASEFQVTRGNLLTLGVMPKDSEMNYDVFISHASEDKDAVVRPLAEQLTAHGLTVWLDELELTLGDSLRRKIDHGLSQSRFGVVILSPHFFSKEWPNKELDALVAREDGREKVILPVWHQVDRDTIVGHSVLLADKLAVRTDDGLEEVAEKIVVAVHRDSGVDTHLKTVRTVPEAKPQGNDSMEFDAELARLLAARSQGSRAYLIGTIMGISVGALFCIAGFIITILGLSGAITWIVEAGTFAARLSNASPGVVFAVLGAIVLWRFKPKVTDRLRVNPRGVFMSHVEHHMDLHAPSFDHYERLDAPSSFIDHDRTE